MAFTRRDFLRLGTSSLALGTLAPLFRCPFLTRPLQAAMLGTGTPKKMILIFLRGGADGINMLIPRGDTDPAHGYNTTIRPTIFIPEVDAIDLAGSTFAQLHPGLAKLADVDAAGDLVSIHRVAYDNQSQSHFSSQQFWENAVPGNEGLEEGWVNRIMQFTPGLDTLGFPAASISPNLQVLFRGPKPIAHIPSLNEYNLGSTSYDIKLLGAAPVGGDNGSGLLGVYGRPADATPYDVLVRDNGNALASSLGSISDAGIDPDSYTPSNGATYPTFDDPEDFVNDFQAFNFFRQLQEAVQLLKNTECRVVGIELDGFDTHSSQEARFPGLLDILAHGIRSVALDLEDTIWNDTLVVTMSEFGRTSAENGSIGTDHAEASCMFIAGGNVNGGVYNCDATTWPLGSMFAAPSYYPIYLSHRTDFRAVLAEIVDKHFGAASFLDDIVPDWSDLSGSGTKYDYLNFLP